MKCFYEVGSFLVFLCESPEENISKATQQKESRVFETLVEIQFAVLKEGFVKFPIYIRLDWSPPGVKYVILLALQYFQPDIFST